MCIVLVLVKHHPHLKNLVNYILKMGSLYLLLSYPFFVLMKDIFIIFDIGVVQTLLFILSHI